MFIFKKNVSLRLVINIILYNFIIHFIDNHNKLINQKLRPTHNRDKEMSKKLFVVAVAAMMAFGFTSCNTITKTAKTTDIPTELFCEREADLEVSAERVSYTMTPSMAIRKGGRKNVINAATAELLRTNGNADVLVERQYEITTHRGLFGTKIKSITVSGRPAKYIFK